MKIPKRVKIAGYNFLVKYPWNRKSFKWSAEISHDNHVIKISNRGANGRLKARAEVEQAFLHEVMHGLNRRYLPRRKQLNEDQVEQISEGLYQVLKDNKLRF